MVTAGATANTTERICRASRESGYIVFTITRGIYWVHRWVAAELVKSDRVCAWWVRFTKREKRGQRVEICKSRRGKHLCAIAIQMSAATAFSKLRNRGGHKGRSLQLHTQQVSWHLAQRSRSSQPQWPEALGHLTYSAAMAPLRLPFRRWEPSWSVPVR